MHEHHHQQATTGSIVLLVFGIFIFLGGMFFTLQFIMLGLMGSSSPEYYNLVGILIMVVGFLCILFADTVRNRFAILSAFCLLASSIWIIIYTTFVPRFREMADQFREAEEKDISSGGAISVFNPRGENAVFHETMLIVLFLVFLAVGLLMLLVYFKPNLFKRKHV